MSIEWLSSSLQPVSFLVGDVGPSPTFSTRRVFFLIASTKKQTQEFLDNFFLHSIETVIIYYVLLLFLFINANLQQGTFCLILRVIYFLKPVKNSEVACRYLIRSEADGTRRLAKVSMKDCEGMVIDGYICEEKQGTARTNW